MRETLFRGKPKDETQYYFFEKAHKDNCIDGFVYGSLVVDGNRCFIAVSGLCKINSVINNGIISMIEVTPETVGQYSGKSDKDGEKLFGGDIVKGLFLHGNPILSVVKFEEGSFGLEWNRGTVKTFSAFTSICNVVYEKLGNIFDNPELLEVANE